MKFFLGENRKFNFILFDGEEQFSLFRTSRIGYDLSEKTF